MSLRTKFNLVLLLALIVGLALAGVISNRIVQDNARREVLHQAELMMEGALSVRAYTVDQIAPLLRPHMTDEFLPQTVPSYAAQTSFRRLRAQDAFRQYTYKDSSKFPFSDFETGGDYESPYASDPGFPTSYDAGYHLDNATASDPSIGEFNGVLVAPENLTSSTTHYEVAFAFTELTGPASAADLCVEVTATDVLGSPTPTQVGNCS